MTNYKYNAETYTDETLSNLLQEITPEEQEWTNFKMQQAAFIYDAMVAKGWNQAAFANKMQVSQSLISKWLSGTQNINSESLWKMQKLLGITLLSAKDVEHPKEMKTKVMKLLVPAAEAENSSFVEGMIGIIDEMSKGLNPNYLTKNCVRFTNISTRRHLQSNSETKHGS